MCACTATRSSTRAATATLRWRSGRARIRAWRAGTQVDHARTASSRPAKRAARRDLYCHFDNDMKVHAPFDARHLATLCADAAATAKS